MFLIRGQFQTSCISSDGHEEEFLLSEDDESLEYSPHPHPPPYIAVNSLLMNIFKVKVDSVLTAGSAGAWGRKCRKSYDLIKLNEREGWAKLEGPNG